jgi:predicted sugar kinase
LSRREGACSRSQQRSRELDAYYRYFKSYAILMDIIPAVRSGDWERVGKLNWEFQFAGTHLSMLQGYSDGGTGIMSALRRMREAGAIVTGMSSVGPAIYCLCSDAEVIAGECGRLGYRFRVAKPDNVGMVAECG